MSKQEYNLQLIIEPHDYLSQKETLRKFGGELNATEN